MSWRRTCGEPRPSRPSRRAVFRTRIGIGLIVVALLALGIYQIARWVTARQGADRTLSAVSATQSVGASTVVLNNVPVVVNALGTVTPIATVTVQSQISGYLTKVAFTEGQMVQKGDLAGADR